MIAPFPEAASEGDAPASRESNLSTGIRGVDMVLGGGLRSGSSTLVCAASGLPIWVFCSQFLLEASARSAGAVYVGWIEASEMRRRLVDYGWNVSGAERDGLWEFVQLTPSDLASQDAAGAATGVARIPAALRRVKAERVILDASEAPWDTSSDAVLGLLRQAIAALAREGVTVLIGGPRERVLIDEEEPRLDTDNLIVLRQGAGSGRHYRTLEVTRRDGSKSEPGEYPFTLLPREGFTVIPLRLKNSFSQVRLLREAIEDGRLLFYAQPILNLKTNRISRYELLLRVRGEREEILLPGEFLEAAADSDLVCDIDRWVVSEAIGLLASIQGQPWKRMPQIEVNLSSRAIGNCEILNQIAADLERTQVDPSHLILEITETAAVADFKEAQEFIARLKGMGCRFALDDFGVGFSSFSHLKHLPVDYVKIDGSFVSNLAADRTDQLIVKAIAEVMHGLGKQTIAEYVRDGDSLRHLRRMGVDYAQGYFVGRPQPISGNWPDRRDSQVPVGALATA